MSRSRTAFFVFALFESLTLSVRMQYRHYRQYYASDIGACREGHGAIQSIISQTDNRCSLLSHILAKLLLLDINSENVFALSIVTASGLATGGRGLQPPSPLSFK